MKLLKSHLLGTTVAALLSLPIATGAALAQQTQDTGSQDDAATTDKTTGQSATTDQATGQSATASDPSSNGIQADSIVATVGDAEIRGSDVLGLIGVLPPQIRSQPPQMLVPLALEQLILRELILEKARSESLAEDPDVVALVERSTQASENDAMVQVWLDREMAKVVTDEAVQTAYDEAKSAGQQDLPPIEQVRPQIEEFLRQQTMQQIRSELRRGADVVLYSPTGQPIGQGGTSGDSSASSTGSTSGSGAAQSDDSASTATDGTESGTSGDATDNKSSDN
tara:strand:+ start:3772 stop:4617 length:846 start_codon:yes stop_codon:yes gene_type:complete